MSPTAHFVRANGIRQHVLEWQGDPVRTVVLLHGYLDQASSMVEIGEGLARGGHRVLATDFRGHGRSGWVPEGGYYHFPDYVADLTFLLDAIAPGSTCPRLALMGHSMGGTVATLYSGTHPDRVRALALLEGLGPPAMGPEIGPERMLRWLRDLAKPHVRERRRMATLDAVVERLRIVHGTTVPDAVLRRVAVELTEPHPSGDGYAWRFDPLHQTMSPSRFDEAAFVEFADRIESPVLMVDAGASGMTLPNLASRKSRFRNRTERTIDGAGHMMHWTQPERVLPEIVPFLR